MIGNIAGSIVGGAVGTAAGGFICAFGYDKYVKDYVAKGVTGIVSVFDTAPLTEAMEAKRAFLWATMAPEERAQLQGLQSGRGDAARLRHAALCPGAEATGAWRPGAGRAAAGGAAAAAVGDLLVGVKKIVLDGPTICTIGNGQVDCTQPPANIGSAVRQISRSLSGVVRGNTLELALRDVFEARDAKCTVTTVYHGPYQVVLEAGGRALGKQSITMSVTGCSAPMTTTNNYSGVGTWRVLE